MPTVQEGQLKTVGTFPFNTWSSTVSVDQLNPHPSLLTRRNGTVNLATGNLNPGDPENLITRAINVDYDPDALMAAVKNRVMRPASTPEQQPLLTVSVVSARRCKWQ
jgi:hypothetical protein